MEQEQISSKEKVLTGKKPKLLARRNKLILVATCLIFSMASQLSAFAYVNHLLAEDPLVNEKNTTKVVNRQLTLEDNPTNPQLLSISADKSLLALQDNNILKIYNLKDGKLLSQKVFSKDSLVALQWLPDRNRLIYASIHAGIVPQKPKVVYEPETRQEDPNARGRAKDRARDRERAGEVRPDTPIIGKGFQLSLFSMDVTQGKTAADGREELIKTLNQKGETPEAVSLNFSTYSNELYVNWQQKTKSYLVLIDIMKEARDIKLPSGILNRLTVIPKSGDLWAEVETDNGIEIYKYLKKRWRHQRELDGYRLLGAANNGNPTLAVDLQNSTSEVDMMELDGTLKSTWAFPEPVKLDNLQMLETGSLLKVDVEGQKTAIYPPDSKLATTLFPTAAYDALAQDGKLLLSLDKTTGRVNVWEEVSG